MPRLRISTAFLIIALLAVWFATAQMPYDIGVELRMAIRCLVFAAPFLGIIHRRGAWQAFWIGCGVFALITFSPVKPQFSNIAYMAQSAVAPDARASLHHFVRETVQYGCVVVLGVLCGLLSVAIYRPAHPVTGRAGKS